MQKFMMVFTIWVVLETKKDGEGYQMKDTSRKWLDSLCQFQQTQNELTHNDKFCCLGVGLQCFIQDQGKYYKKDYYYLLEQDKDVDIENSLETPIYDASLPLDVVEYLDLNSDVGKFEISKDEIAQSQLSFKDKLLQVINHNNNSGISVDLSLAWLNDSGFSFAEIKEFCETFPNYVFKSLSE